MTLYNFKNIFSEELKNIYTKQEIEVLFFIVLEHCAKISKIDYFLHSKNELPTEKITCLEWFLKELQKNKPIQYLLKETTFFGLSFYVDTSVLIPRQETEELVDWILQSVDKQESIKILDVGTGSGCIAISLAKNLPNAEIFGIDISSEALQVAKMNAEKNSVSISLLQKNIFEMENLPHQYDIIVSNPPYVRELEKAEIARNVLDNEPHLALFVPDEKPLIFYEKIADLAKKHLSENGKLFFEINEYLGNEMCEMLSEKGFRNIELRCDLSAKDRMILAQK